MIPKAHVLQIIGYTQSVKLMLVCRGFKNAISKAMEVFIKTEKYLYYVTFLREKRRVIITLSVK